MKKTLHLIFSILIICNIASCSKDKNTSLNYYLKFKLDAVDYNYTSVLGYSGLKDPSSSSTNYSTEVQALTDNSNFIMELYTKGTPKSNTNFTSDNAAETDFNNFVGIDLEINNASLVSFEADGGNIALILTEVAVDHIKGTFSGTLKDHSSGVSHTVTNGEFYIPLSTQNPIPSGVIKQFNLLKHPVQ